MNALSNEQLHAVAPSIFATEPYHEVSNRYMFIPTIDVVDFMRSKNWFPVSASESRTRLAGKVGKCRHLIRYRNPDVVVSDKEVPEIIQLNSHDRTSAYQLMAGFYVFACANGIITGSNDFGGFSIRHLGRDELLKQVNGATDNIVNRLPSLVKTVNEWKQINLGDEHQEAFASAVNKLTGYDYARGSKELLMKRRYADSGNDLWSVFNRVQENVIRGGLYKQDENKRYRRIKAVKAIDKNVKLNKAIWEIAENTQKGMA